MRELPEELIERLSRIVSGENVTESELRAVDEEAEGLARVLAARVDASERRLTELSGDSMSSLSDTAGELRRVEALRPALQELRRLRIALEVRARELRTEWLLQQRGAGSPGDARLP